MTSEQLAEIEEPLEVVAPATAVEGRSPMQLAKQRFFADRKSVIAGIVSLLFILGAVAAPILVKVGVLDYHGFNQDLLREDTMPAGSWGGVSWHHWLGVAPQTGWDVLSRVWFGMSLSLGISLAAAIISCVVGVALGIVAGFSRGFADTLIGRLIDLTLAFPQQLLALATASMAFAFIHEYLHLPAGDWTRAFFVIAIMSIFGWPGLARLVRGQVLSIREREFIEAAELLGASKWRIYVREILPNLWSLILVNFTLTLPAYISAEAAFSFMGISIVVPTPTLGNVLNASLTYATIDPLYFAVPGILIAALVVSFNLFGDGLRDALDPKGSR
ncbi:MAG: ABC transporter permease [Nocardioides sp.]|uniref:ABC transporter permease n=1 Tax=Nocardioides sp. TaxID=35761 RepID=UPI0039E22938